MILLLILIVTNIFLLNKIVFFPYPELFIYPYLTNHGLIPYSNIFDQHFPGLMFFPINLGTLGMITPQIARLWQYGIVIVVHLILYFVSRKFFGNKKAILANVFFLLWQPFFEGWVLWIDSFLPILTLLSLFFLKSKRLFWAGLMLGLALVFKQVLIPLIGLVALYLIFKERKFETLFIFGLGVLVPVSFLALYITNLGIWKDFIFWTVTFNMTTFAQMGRKYGTVSEIIRVAGIYGLASFAFFDKKVKEDTMLVGLFLVGSLASIYARFDFVNLQPSLPFVALLSVVSISWLIKKKYLKFLIIIYILASIFLLFRFYKSNLGDKVFFFGDNEKRVVAEIQKLSSANEKIFTLGTLPHIYQMADRLPAGNLFVFQFSWFMVEAEDRILTGIINDPPKVVIRDLTAQVEGKNLILYMPKINNYINEKYMVVDRVNEVEIMVKK